MDVFRRIRDVSFSFSSDVVLLYVRCRKVRQAFFVVSTCLRVSQAFFMDRSRTPTVHGYVHDYIKKKIFKREKSVDRRVRLPDSSIEFLSVEGNVVSRETSSEGAVFVHSGSSF